MVFSRVGLAGAAPAPSAAGSSTPAKLAHRCPGGVTGTGETPAGCPGRCRRSRARPAGTSGAVARGCPGATRRRACSSGRARPRTEHDPGVGQDAHRCREQGDADAGGDQGQVGLHPVDLLGNAGGEAQRARGGEEAVVENRGPPAGPQHERLLPQGIGGQELVSGEAVAGGQYCDQGLVEQRDVELLLEPPDLLAQRRLGDIRRSAARPKCISSTTTRK